MEISHPSTGHYDLDVQFFRGFLDPYLKYTSGLFSGSDDDLNGAIVRMLDVTLQDSGIASGSKVLEVGHGWGSLLRRIRETIPEVDYTGISPSLAQHAFMKSNFDPRADLHLSTLEAAPLNQEHYDAAFLIGVYCHLADKKAQLARVAKSLRPGGRVVLEDTFFLSQYLHRRHSGLPMTRFVQQDIFGYAHILPLSEFVDDLRDCGLSLVQVRDTTDSYRRTIQHWIRRLPDQGSQYPDLTRGMIRCLKLAQAGWDYTIGNYLITLERR